MYKNTARVLDRCIKVLRVLLCLNLLAKNPPIAPMNRKVHKNLKVKIVFVSLSKTISGISFPIIKG